MKVLINLKLKKQSAGFSLVEVLLSVMICAFSAASVCTGYVLSAKRAQIASCSQAAVAQALQRIEQARGAKWDTSASTTVDQLIAANFAQQVVTLDLPVQSGSTNAISATNTITITTISTSPPMRMVRCDTTWRLPWSNVYTNTLVVYRTPDQ